MKKMKRILEPWIWMLPCLVFLFVFAYKPFFKIICNSFFIVDKTGNTVKYVGIENYQVLLNDTVFVSAIKNTVVFTLVTVPATLIVGFFFAVLSLRNRRTSLVYETLFSIPCAVSLSVAAMIFQVLYMPNIGLINKISGLSLNWLYDPKLALYALAIIQIWASSSFAYIFYLDSLRNISTTLIDSAMIEGANFFQFNKYVFIPLTLPTTLYLLFANITTSMMMMSLSNILTNGGPQNSTTTLVQYIYSKFISTGNLTLTNAAAVLYLAMTLFFVVFLMLALKKWRRSML